MIELYLKIAVAFFSLAGLVLGIYKLNKAYKTNVAEELRNHSHQLIVHDDAISTHRDDIDEMKANFQKAFDGLGDDLKKFGEEVNSRVEKIEDKNREDHRLLFSSLENIAISVSEIKGYLKAKNEKDI